MRKFKYLAAALLLMFFPVFLFSFDQDADTDEESYDENPTEETQAVDDNSQDQDWLVAGSVQTDENNAGTEESGVRQQLCGLVEQQLGINYVSGGDSPESGFDCSGLIQYVFYANGINIPRTSREQFETGVSKGLDGLKPGDVVFFQVYSDGILGQGRILNKITEYVKTNPTHVGIYIGNGIFIHAPSSGQTIKKSDLRSSFWRSHLIGIRDYTGETGTMAKNEPSTADVAKAEAVPEIVPETVLVDINRGIARARETAEDIMKSEEFKKASEKTSELMAKAKRAYKAAAEEWLK